MGYRFSCHFDTLFSAFPHFQRRKNGHSLDFSFRSDSAAKTRNMVIRRMKTQKCALITTIIIACKMYNDLIPRLDTLGQNVKQITCKCKWAEAVYTKSRHSLMHSVTLKRCC